MKSNRRVFLGQLGLGLAAIEATGQTINPSNITSEEAFWDNVRKGFPLTDNRVYLNNGTFGPSPKAVLDAIKTSLDKTNTSGEYGHTDKYRKVLAEFVGAREEEISLTHNTTEGINIICWGLDLKKDDEVIISLHEHVGNALPWLNRAKLHGIKLRTFEPASTAEETLERIKSLVTSKTKVKFPIYLEARIKVSNLELSSNFWLLSQNDEREIDILEVYGGAADTWFAKNMSTNFHVFLRDEQTNQIISDFNDQTHNIPSTGTYWRDQFHRFGAYWKSPTEVTFYIDGQQTPDGSWAQVVMIDKDYTGATLDKSQYNMDQEAFIIIDTEDHDWRSNQGIVASDAELADGSKNKMYVDWIRVYKPVDGVVTGNTNLQAKHSGRCIDVAQGAMINGSQYQQWTCDTTNTNQSFKFISAGNNEYLIQSTQSNLCVELKDNNSANGANIHQWVCNSANDNQKWTLHDKGDQHFEIRSKVTGKCIDVAGKATTNGANIVQWSCYNGQNQRFKFLQ